MAKRFQIVHYFHHWTYAESFDSLDRAKKFAMKVLKSNYNMKAVKVKDNKANRIKLHLKKQIIRVV